MHAQRTRRPTAVLGLVCLALSLSLSLLGGPAAAKGKRPPPRPPVRVDTPAPGTAASPAGRAPAGPGRPAADPRVTAEPKEDDRELRRGERVEFDGRLIEGQTAASGAIYLFERLPSELRSMVQERRAYRREILETVYPNGTAPAPSAVGGAAPAGGAGGAGGGSGAGAAQGGR